MAWDLQERRPVAGVDTGARLTEPYEQFSQPRGGQRAAGFSRLPLARRAHPTPRAAQLRHLRRRWRWWPHWNPPGWRGWQRQSLGVLTPLVALPSRIVAILAGFVEVFAHQREGRAQGRNLGVDRRVVCREIGRRNGLLGFLARQIDAIDAGQLGGVNLITAIFLAAGGEPAGLDGAGEGGFAQSGEASCLAKREHCHRGSLPSSAMVARCAMATAP